MRRRSSCCAGKPGASSSFRRRNTAPAVDSTYSTAEAVQLIRISREQRAVPVMFPEWPRRDVDETQRIYDLHASIAQSEPACVAPIGQAWDLALARDPTLTLHASDGNHSVARWRFPHRARALRDDHRPVASRRAADAAVSDRRFAAGNAAWHRRGNRGDDTAANVVLRGCDLTSGAGRFTAVSRSEMPAQPRETRAALRTSAPNRSVRASCPWPRRRRCARTSAP